MNRVSNCEIPRPPIETIKDESQQHPSAILKETIQNEFSNMSKKLIENKFYFREEIHSMYQIAKLRPEVEAFEVTLKTSPETIRTYITSTQAEAHMPKKNM